MTSKERIVGLLRGEIPDRVGRADAPWPETRARWQREGMPTDLHFNDYFQMDVRRMIKIDTSFRLPESLLEEGPDYRLVRTAEGTLERQWKHAGVPHQLEYAVRNEADWKRLKERLVPSLERFSFGYYGDFGFEYRNGPFEAVRSAYEGWADPAHTAVLLSVVECYESAVAKLGDENTLLALGERRAWLEDLFDTHLRLVLAMMDLAFQSGFRPDALLVGGDIAYRNGLLFSPQLYRELLLPRHQALFAHAHGVYGLPVIYHGDGNLTEAIPMLIEAGADALQPLEVAAGLDVRTLGPAFGDHLAFMGNISVAALTRGGNRLREEVKDKLRFVTRHRIRYIFHSDHSVPPEVSWSNYCSAMELVDRYGRY